MRLTNGRCVASQRPPPLGVRTLQVDVIAVAGFIASCVLQLLNYPLKVGENHLSGAGGAISASVPSP